MRKIHKMEFLVQQKQDDLRIFRRQITDAVKSALTVKSLSTSWAFDGRQTSFEPDKAGLKVLLRFESRGKRNADSTALTSAVRASIDEHLNHPEPAIKAEPETEAPTETQAPAPPPETPAETQSPKVDDDDADEPPPPPPPPINIDRTGFFDHIFNREAQIEILHSAIKAAVETDFKNRFHVVMCGPPGCGKTEILRSVRNMIGESHVLLLDGPGTTKAGAEQFLLKVDRIHPFVLIEEIEKMHPMHMQWLLGLLDERGEVRRTNARDGHIQRDARVLCVATVNDLSRFRALMHGSLASRFSHEIYCPRPDNDVLEKIAMREIEKVNGNPFWVNPAVNYCVQVERTYDPRRILSVCLSGRDDLLDGTYQRALMANRELQRQAMLQTEAPKKGGG